MHRAEPPANVTALRTAAQPHHPLPAQPTALIGREQEVALARALLEREDVRLLTLTGPPGAGKTRLSLAIAERLAPSYPDGVRFIPLEALREPDRVIATIARALDVREAGARPITELLIERLQGRTVLLILDNFEQILPAGAQLGELLAACPSLALLVTSRAPLRIRWEYELPVPPLAVPGVDGSLQPPPSPSLRARTQGTAAGTEGDLTQYPAVTLFVERAQRVRPDFRLTAENAAEVAAICARLDGLPLALELAAARIRLLSPAALLARLEHRLRLLTSGARDLPARHQTLRAAIAWSYDLLSEHERALFRRLGVFVGGCTMEAGTAIAGEETDADRIEEMLSNLVEQSLMVRADQADEAPRLRMLETIREFALEQLEASDEAESVQLQHAAIFLSLAEMAEPHLRGPEQQTWLERLEAEHDNLRAALRWSLASGHEMTALQLAGCLRTFWFVRAYFSEGRRWLEQVAAATPRAPATGRARLFEGLGVLAWQQGDYAAARGYYEQALALGREMGNRGGVAATLNSLGALAQLQGDRDAAIALYEESLELCRELGITPGVASILNNLGALATSRGEYARARERLQEALELHRSLGDSNSVAGTLINLAAIEETEGNYDRARALLEEGLAIRRTLGVKGGIANVLASLGAVMGLQDDYAAGRAAIEESITIRREIGDRPGIAVALNQLGNLLRRQGDEVEAGRCFVESLTVARELGHAASLATALYSLAALAATEQPQRAARLYGAEERLREEMGEAAQLAGRSGYEASVETLRDALGETAFLAAWQAGRALPLGQAIDEALALSDGEAEAVEESTVSGDGAASTARRASLPAGLTNREVEVLRLIARGLTSREIAETLVVSLSTVERHIANLYGKIGARGRADATAFAFSHGLVQPETP